MLEDQYEMTEDLLSPQSGGADALPPQKLRPTKQQLKNRTKIILIILAAAIAIGAMFAYRAYAHSQYEKKLDLAEKYMDEGKTAQAKLAFEDAAQIEKRNPEPYIEMGKMYFDNGDYDQAIKYLTSANQRQETSESYYKIADSYEEKGRGDFKNRNETAQCFQRKKKQQQCVRRVQRGKYKRQSDLFWNRVGFFLCARRQNGARRRLDVLQHRKWALSDRWQQSQAVVR